MNMILQTQLTSSFVFYIIKKRQTAILAFSALLCTFFILYFFLLQKFPLLILWPMTMKISLHVSLIIHADSDTLITTVSEASFFPYRFIITLLFVCIAFPSITIPFVSHLSFPSYKLKHFTNHVPLYTLCCRVLLSSKHKPWLLCCKQP